MANFNLNKVILGGRLCAKPELKQTKSGVPVTDITVAVNRRYSGKDENGQAVQPQADFIRIILWRHDAEFVCRYFDKGSAICIVGSIQTRTWTDKHNVKQYATEVVADEVHFVDSKGEGHTSSAPGTSAPMPAYYTAEGGNGPQFETIADDDELPF